MNKRKQKLTLGEMCKILQALKDCTQTKTIYMQSYVSKFTITQIKKNNESIQKFVTISI